MYGISEELLRELIITDRKGQKKIFVDTAVYTRNRHFRTLGSTKLNKSAPLLVSHINPYQPKLQADYSMFLSSLITYFDDDNLKLLEFGPPIVDKITMCGPSCSVAPVVPSSTIDAFISQVC